MSEMILLIKTTDKAWHGCAFKGPFTGALVLGVGTSSSETAVFRRWSIPTTIIILIIIIMLKILLVNKFYR